MAIREPPQYTFRERMHILLALFWLFNLGRAERKTLKKEDINFYDLELAQSANMQQIK